MKATTEEIIEIVSKWARAGATITETSHLHEDLWMSTSDFEEMANEIQERFGERLSVEDFRSGKISSVGDIVDYLKAQDWGSRSFSGCDDEYEDNDVSTANVRSTQEYVPEELKGWNWGAALLSGIWALGNGAYKFILLYFVLMILPYGFILCFILFGKKGNEWAWKAKHWSNVDEFKRVQHRWTIAGLIVTPIYIVINIIALLCG